MGYMSVYRCPCCGGDIHFDSQSQKLSCPYCDTVFDIETLKKYNEAQEVEDIYCEEQEREFLEEGIVVYSCQTCGGQIICDENTIATHCPYCNSPVVMNENVEGQLKPDYIIPFQIDKRTVETKIQEFFYDKPFLPKQFKQDSFITDIDGLYVPFWTYDCRIEAQMRYRTVKVKKYSDAQYFYTETKHYLSTREGNICFGNVPVDAASKIDDDSMQSIEPFDFSKAVEFKMDYLAGYFANKYDVNQEISEQKAIKRIEQTTKEQFRASLDDYRLHSIEDEKIYYKNKNAKYFLLPVWILNLKWHEQTFTLYANGQTGKVIGDLPIDTSAYWKSFWLYFLIYACIIEVLIFIFVNGG